MTACIGTSKQVSGVVKRARQAGFAVNEDPEHIQVTDLDGAPVYQAMLKGGDVWIVRYDPSYFEKGEDS